MCIHSMRGPVDVYVDMYVSNVFRIDGQQSANTDTLTKILKLF